MQIGIGLGMGFSGLPGLGQPALPPELPHTPRPYDRVVVIGASLVAQTFGQDLAVPSEQATNTFRNAGLSVDVYGYGWSGYGIYNGIPKVAEALAAFPDRTLFVVHLGGNDVSLARPFATATAYQLSQMESNYDDLVATLAPRADDVILCPVTFRTYEAEADVAGRDDLFVNEEKGSKPFNDAIFLPRIAAAFPGTMNTDGMPVLDLYNATRNIYDLFIKLGDGVHPSTPEGRQALIGILAERLGYFLTGGFKPAPYVPATTVGAGFEANPWDKLFVQFGTEIKGANIVLNATVNAGAKRLYTALGKSTSVFLDVTHPGPNSASGYSLNTNGRPVGEPRFTGDIYCDPVMHDNLYTAAAAPMTIALSGLEPGAHYRIGATGSRVATQDRISRLEDTAGTFIEWNSSLAPPAPVQSMTCQASGMGTITLSLSAASGTYAYLSGMTLRPA